MVTTIRLPADTFDRIGELSSEVGNKHISTTIRGLIHAALGDSASVAAQKEISFLVEDIRRRLLGKLAQRFGQDLEQVVRDVAREIVDEA